MTKDEALKLALDWFKCYAYKSMSRNNAEALADEVVDALQEALAQPAQPEQEPVAWMFTSKWKGNERFFTRYQSDLTTYKADKVWPLCTTPPKRKPLTDELETLFTNIDHAISSGAWNVQTGSQTWETIEEAKAAHDIKE
jgi:hypothetical protein